MCVPLRSRNPVPAIDFDDELAVSGPDDADDIIDHLFDATEGIDALPEVDWHDEEEDRCPINPISPSARSRSCGR